MLAVLAQLQPITGLVVAVGQALLVLMVQAHLLGLVVLDFPIALAVVPCFMLAAVVVDIQVLVQRVVLGEAEVAVLVL